MNVEFNNKSFFALLFTVLPDKLKNTPKKNVYYKLTGLNYACDLF